MDKKGESPGKFGDIDFTKLNMGQIVELCLKCETKEDANDLLMQYGKCFDDPTIARDNLGYMFGYYNSDVRKKLYDLFPVNHPIFGPEFGRGDDLSPEEAFKIGETMGEEIKEGMKKYMKDKEQDEGRV